MLLLPICMVAQELKIAFVNSNDIISSMPEITAMQNELEALRNSYQKDLKSMNDEYEKKMSDYISQKDSLPENILMNRVQDIQDLQGRMEILQQAAVKDIDSKQNELFEPILDKVRKAIEQVGEENDYTIFDSSAILAKGKGVIDATDKVRAKLGLK